MYITKSILQQLKSAVPIQSILHTNTKFTKRGKNLFSLCPLHKEKTPSFSINTENNTFKCFGCNAMGDCIDLLIHIHNLSFHDAITTIAKQANIDLPDHKAPEPKQSEASLLHFAENHYNITLLNNKEVLHYLQTRDITESDVEKYGIGYDNGTLYATAKKIGINTSQLPQLGLTFNNRITFKITNTQNQTIAFGARALNDLQPKYLNSPNSDYFIKNLNHFIPQDFLHNAQKKDHVIITEGYTDAIQAWKNGYNQTIAINGTYLSPQAIDNIADIVNNITLALDNDPPGHTATLKILPQLLRKNLTITFADLHTNEDLDKTLRKDPTIHLLQLSDYFINMLKQDLNTSKKQLLQSTKQMINIIKQIPSITYQIDTKRAIAQSLQLPITIL